MTKTILMTIKIICDSDTYDTIECAVIDAVKELDLGAETNTVIETFQDINATKYKKELV